MPKKQSKIKRQNRPSEIRLSGVPPIMPIRPKKNHPVKLEIPIKTRKKKEKQRQNRPSEIRLSGVPL